MGKLARAFEMFPAKKTIKNVVPDLRLMRDDEFEAEYKFFECSSCKQDKVRNWTFSIGGGTWHDVKLNDRCLDCMNNRQVHKVTEEMKQKRVETMLAKWWFIPEDDESGFKNFNTTNSVLEGAKEAAKHFIHDVSKGITKERKNLLLMGSVGTGKSHLSKAIAKTIQHRGFKVAYIQADEFFRKLKSTFSSSQGEIEYKRIMEEYAAFDLVIIDDIGTESAKRGDDVSWTVRTWLELINARQGKLNVWSTNLDDSSLAQIVGQRAFDRMYEHTKFVDMFTDSFRKTKKVD